MNSLLEKGNWDDLQGRVTAYAGTTKDVCCDSHREGIVAMHISTDILSFRERTGMTKEEMQGTEHIEKMLQEAAEEEGAHVITIKRALIHLSLSEIPNLKEDVIFAGNYDHTKSSIRAIDLASKLYFVRFTELFSKKHNIEDVINKSKEVILTHKEFLGRSISEHIFREYIGQMTYSLQGKDKKRFDDLSSRLLRFAEGSHFSNDVAQLISLIRDNSSPNIISAYVRKADAIHQEKFLEAQVASTELKSLSAGKYS